MLLLLLLAVTEPGFAQHFRGGTLLWNRHGQDGNRVVFVFAGTFTRSYLGFRRGGIGSPPNVGDTIVLAGTEPIRFQAGQDPSEAGLAVRLRVTEIDEEEDWLKGVWTHEHLYPSPTNNGAAWAANIAGCCRYSEYHAQANTPFQMIAAVDLTWTIGYTPAKGSGHVPSVGVLRTFAGPPPPSPTPPPPDAFSGIQPPLLWEEGYENHFLVAHPNLHTSLIDCQSEHAKMCTAAANVVDCDQSAAPPLVPGIDCAPYTHHCLKLLCPARYPLKKPPGMAGGGIVGGSVGGAVGGTGGGRQELDAHAVIDTEGLVVEKDWRNGRYFFVRLSGQSNGEGGAGLGPEAGGAWLPPGEEECRAAVSQFVEWGNGWGLDVANDACETVHGCCTRSGEVGVGGGGGVKSCVPCITVSSDGELKLEATTPPGIKPLSIALSRPPPPLPHACVDAPQAWVGPRGATCMRALETRICSSNITGAGGLLARDVCCECGGGVFPVGGFPDGMQGLDGVYVSAQGASNKSNAGRSCVNGSHPLGPGGPLSAPGSFWNMSLTISAVDFSASIRYEEFAPPNWNLSVAQAHILK